MIKGVQLRWRDRATKLLDVANGCLADLAGANAKQLYSIVTILGLAHEMDSKLVPVLLSRAKAYILLRRSDLAYVDVCEALTLTPTSIEGRNLLAKLRLRLLPKKVHIEDAAKCRAYANRAVTEGNYSEATRLLSRALHLTPDAVPLLMQRAQLYRKCKRFDLAYVDACETNALLHDNKQGAGVEAAHVRRDALSHLENFMRPHGCPSVIMSRLASIQIDPSFSAMLGRPSAITKPPVASLYVLGEAARLDAADGLAVFPKLQLAQLPEALTRTEGQLKEVVLVDVKFDKKCLDVFSRIAPRLCALDWLVLEAVDFRSLPSSHFELLFGGSGSNGQQGRVGVLQSVHSISFSDIRLPASLSYDQLLRMEVLRNASQLLLHTSPESITARPPSKRFTTESLMAYLAKKPSGGQRRHLELWDSALAEPISEVGKRLKQDFYGSKTRTAFRLVITCANEESKAAARPSSRADLPQSSGIFEMTQSEGAQLYDRAPFGRMFIDRLH